jgi:DNA repair photolyase
VGQKTYDIVKEQVNSIDFEKVLPANKPLFPVDRPKTIDLATIKRHIRAKRAEDFDLLEGKYIRKQRVLPEDYKTLLEVSCRASECPLPLNMDVYSSGVCYGCIYCFAKLFEQSLYSAFYDDYKYQEVRVASKKYISEVLNKYFRGKGSGAEAKAIAQRMPIRLGIRTEDFQPQYERKMKRSLHAMKIILDNDYPMMINTKSDLLVEGDWFKTICKFGNKIAVQFSIIHCDDKTGKKLELGAPDSSRRFECVKILNEVGIRAMPRIEPTMAYINGTEDHIEEFAEKCAEAGAPHVTLDTYSYFANADGIRKNFYIQGFDYDRMFEVTSNDITTGSILLEKVMFSLQDRGIGASTFNFHSLPFNTMDVCCGVDEKLGGKKKARYNDYNTLSAVRRMIKTGEELDWGDFVTDAINPLNKEIRDKVASIWLKANFSPWSPDIAGGVEVCGADEEGFPIYDYREERLRRDYERIVEFYGG